MTYPSSLLNVGIGLETSYGVAAQPATLWPVDSCNPRDINTPVIDTGWRAAPFASYGEQPGALAAQLQFAGPVLPDTIGYPLAGLLGDVTVTGSGAPYTTAIAAYNTGAQQPPSYTVTTADPVSSLLWPGVKFSQLQMTLTPDGLFAFTANADCLSAVSVTPPWRGTSTGVLPLAGWRGTVTIGGSVEARAESVTVTINRAIETKRNVNGNRNPYLQRSALVSVTGQATIMLTSDAYRQAYINGTGSSVDVTIGQGSGAGQTQVKLHSSTVTLTGGARQYSQKWVQVVLAWTADANTTDAGGSGGYSPIKATLMNASPAGTYK